MANDNTMDEATENEMNSDTPMPDNIDDLLNEAGNALDDLEAQLNDDTAPASSKGNKKPADLSDAEPDIGNVDDTLASLEDELNNLSLEMDDDNPSEKNMEATEGQKASFDLDPELQSALNGLGDELDRLNDKTADKTQNDDATPAPADAAIDAPLENTDDFTNAPLNDIEQAEPDTQESQINSSPVPSPDDIDSLLADFSDNSSKKNDLTTDSTESAKADDSKMPARQDIDSGNIDDALAALADDLEDVDGPEISAPDDSTEQAEQDMDGPEPPTQSDILQESRGIDGTLAEMNEEVDQLNKDISAQLAPANSQESQVGDLQKTEPVKKPAGQNIDDLLNQAQNSMETNLPEPKVQTDVSEDDAMVLDELEEATKEKSFAGPQGEKNDENDSQDDNRYAHFSLPQKTVLKSFETANKPFKFIDDGIKDTLGVVAMVTLLISMITTAIALLVK
ncbi:MAG: hypothetical protein K9M57_05060 [Phycisphaerae bacterium]|nr:hypothetical protein [Phycisphaerae bacterium]